MRPSGTAEARARGSVPASIATSVLCFIFEWNEFLHAFMLGGKVVVTLPVAVPKLSRRTA